MDLLTVLGVAVLLTRVGLALYVAGLVRAKNSAGAVLRAICDLCVTVLAFWAVGAAILFQEHNHVLWLRADLLFGWKLNVEAFSLSFVFFNFVMLLTASGVVAGVVAERFRFFPLCIASLVLGGFVFPVAGKWIWTGWLARHGFFDLGGASALQMSAGIFAAVAAGVVGPRTGKFNKDGSSSMIPGHNLPLASVGVLVILAGWVAYVAGAAFAHTLDLRTVAPAALNVLLAASAGGLASLLFGEFRYGKPDVVLALSGMLGGLVAISAGAAALPTWAAVIIGAVAGLIVPATSVVIDLRARLDDPCALIAVTAVGGAWGTLAVGFFLPLSAHLTRFELIAVQVVGIACIAAFSALVAIVVFVLLKKTVGIRAREADEFDGLDLAEHDIGAYPDFQQTMIKSYHLREV